MIQGGQDLPSGSRPTAVLRNEHVLINRVLDVLERMIVRMQEGDSPDPDSLEKAIDFFSGFADKEHHMKEEDALFPGMVECGFHVVGSPIEVMLHEHDDGRDFLKGIRRGLADLESDRENATAIIQQNARDYLHLLRAHIEKENQILFEMADRILTPEAAQKVLQKFAHVEAELAQGPRRYEELAEELERRFG